MPANRYAQAMVAFGVACALLAYSHRTHADELIRLAAGERIPYIGQSLPENGVVTEVVTEAFRRRGYQVRIDFYPWARARKLAEMGDVQGVLPITAEAGDHDTSLVYSRPVAVHTLGFLKKRQLGFSYPKSPVAEAGLSGKTLPVLRVGTLRGGVNVRFVDTDKKFVKEMADSDLQNLDKLAGDRIQLALIDQYTAADLISGRRPNLIGKLDFVPLEKRNFHVGFSTAVKGHQKILVEFNRGIDELARDGTLQKIRESHGFFQPSQPVAGKTSIAIATVNNSDMRMMQEMSKDFESQHPDIALEWRVLDENTLRQRLLGDLAISDGQYDVMMIGTYEAPIWAKNGWIVPLDLPAAYDVDDLLSPVRSAFTVDGQLFALPFYAESSMTFYRKDLFATAGIVMPVTPTYEDIKRFASKIHHPEAGVYGICLRGKPGWGENMAYLGTLVNVHGGRWFDEKWHPELDTRAWEQAVSLYKDLLVRYGPPHPERNGYNENLALFSEGHCGMWIDATVAASLLLDPGRPMVAGRVGYVSAPVAATRKGAAWLWSWAFAIPESSRKKDAATMFISWATSREYIREVAKRHGWLAVPPGTRQSTYASEGYRKAAPFSDFVFDAIVHADIHDSSLEPKPYAGIQYVGIPEFPAIGNQVGMEIEKALTGKISVKEALAASQEKTAAQMKRSGYPGNGLR